MILQICPTKYVAASEIKNIRVFQSKIRIHFKTNGFMTIDCGNPENALQRAAEIAVQANEALAPVFIDQEPQEPETEPEPEEIHFGG